MDLGLWHDCIHAVGGTETHVSLGGWLELWSMHAAYSQCWAFTGLYQFWWSWTKIMGLFQNKRHSSRVTVAFKFVCVCLLLLIFNISQLSKHFLFSWRITQEFSGMLFVIPCLILFDDRWFLCVPVPVDSCMFTDQLTVHVRVSTQKRPFRVGFGKV